MDIRWPGLSYEQWADTWDTLHLWTQVIGKVKLALTPFLTAWWNVALSPAPAGCPTDAGAGVSYARPPPWRDGTTPR